MRDHDVLIIGGDSKIGAELFLFLESKGLSVLSTTRSTIKSNSQKIYLDLANIDEFDLGRFEVSCAIICAGMTSIMACEKNPEDSFNINYIGTSSLIEKLLSRNIKIIFVSTDLLGTEEKSVSNYSIGKMLIEKKLLSHESRNFAIIRLGKVITKKFRLFDEWFENAIIGNRILTYGNIQMYPLSIQYVCESIYKIYKDNLSGLFKVGPKTGITYYDACRYLFDRCGLNLNLIEYTICEESKLLPYGKITIVNHDVEKNLGNMVAPECINALDFYINKEIR